MTLREVLLGGCLISATMIPVVAQTQSFTGATANMAPGDPAGQWTRQARDYANTRYSPLTQINQKNVGRLRIAWTLQRRADVWP